MSGLTGPVLIITQHQGLFHAFSDILARNGLIAYDQDIFSLNDALMALQNEESQPRAILMIERGYELEQRGAVNRYQIVEGIVQTHGEIPIIYCADQADRGFFDWATAQQVTVISPSQPGKTPEKEMIAALNAVLQGTEPSVAVPPREEKPRSKHFLSRVTEAGLLGRKKERPAEEPPEATTRQPLEAPSAEPGRLLPDAGEAERMAWQEPAPTSEETAELRAEVQSEPEPILSEEPAIAASEPHEPLEAPIPEPEYAKAETERGVTSTEEAKRETDDSEEEGDAKAAAPVRLPKPRFSLDSFLPSRRSKATPEPERPPKTPDFPERSVIGVFALTRGAGATRMACDLADYLKDFGLTALVAMDGKSDLDYALDNERIAVSVPDISQAPAMLATLVGSRMYRFIICDYGTPVELLPNGMPVQYDLTEKEPMLIELRRCDMRICCTSSEPWHQKKERFLQHLALHSSLIVRRGEATPALPELVEKLYHPRPQLLR